MNAANFIAFFETLRDRQLVSPSDLPEGIQVNNFSKAKFVSKPWGFELWLVDNSAFPYAMKILSVRKGQRLSLQYHEKKMEHHFLFVGQIKLHYQSTQTKEVVSRVFSEGTVIQVLPLAKHRIEAISDALLLEVSTNYMEDVIRLEDDYRRV